MTAMAVVKRFPGIGMMAFLRKIPPPPPFFKRGEPGDLKIPF
jgi:hypothetical protein